jgi:hypothetical protein
MELENTRQLIQRVTQRLLQSPIMDRTNVAMIVMGLLILLLGSYATFG